MLLRFGVSNHLSIRDHQELSLVASSLKDSEEGIIDCGVAPSGRLLPVAVIYGANASGKSNIVAALEFMRSAVLYSHSRGMPGEGVPYRPFALDPSCAGKPSVFDVDFVVNGIRYHYGFKVSEESFDAEWLHVFPHGRVQVLYERAGKSFQFGRNLKGRNKIIADLTRDNSLFLSAAVQNGHEYLTKVAKFFHSLRNDTDISIPGGLASIRLAEHDVDRRSITFLHNIGTGVIDYRRQEEEISEEIQATRHEMVSLLMKTLKRPVKIKSNIDNDDKFVAIELAHLGSDGKPIFFNLDWESAGTRRLLVLLGHAFQVIDEGALLIIDELDASLHTLACENLLRLFSSHETNPNGAQMVATTHDTNILRLPVLRRDQVWFTEKDTKGATHLYPLTDIRTRKGDNIEKGYLEGRYGAIPFAGPVPDAVSAE